MMMMKGLTPDLNILVVYPRLNQGEYISSLVHSKLKFVSEAGGEAQGQRKNKITNAF